MKINFKSISIAYFILLVIEIWLSENQIKLGIYITKPLLMPFLMFLGMRHQLKNKILYLALFFSFLGDVFLMFDKEIFFLLGLGSFLLAQLSYIKLFGLHKNLKIIPSLIFAVYSVTYISILKPALPNGMLIPVVLYCISLTLMGISALNRNILTKGYFAVLIGAILFIISDSIIAYTKFLNPIAFSSFWVMSTYGIAQWLIVKGWLDYELDQELKSTKMMIF